jgi:hypothetical protein
MGIAFTFLTYKQEGHWFEAQWGEILNLPNPSGLVDVVAVTGYVFMLVYNFHVPLAFKVGCPSCGAGCDIAFVFTFLCVGLMANFVVVCFNASSTHFS